MINELRTQLIEKEAELSKLRNQYAELRIQYDALRTLTGGLSTTYVAEDDAQVQREAVTQTLSMGNIFKQ